MELCAKAREVDNFVLRVLLLFVLSAHRVASRSADLWSEFEDAQPLLCNVHCSCTFVDFHNYHVECNKPTAKVHLLTAQVNNLTLTSATQSKKIYVSVLNVELVLVTENFLQEWEKYKSSALDLWHIGNLVFEPRTKITKSRTRLDFGGVGIVNSTVFQLPEGLINNKKAASLLFINTTVDLIPSETLMRVDKLRYLVVNKSRIGILKGSPVSRSITLSRLRRNLEGISFHDSVFGTIEGNALNIVSNSRYSRPEQFTISNSKIGLLERNGIQLEGKLAIKVTETYMFNTKTGSLKINTTSSVNIVNNTFVGQPGLLVDLPCGVSTVVQRNLFINTELRVSSSGSQTNKDTDPPEESSVLTDQPRDEDEATHNNSPMDFTDSISTTTVIPEASSLLQDPGTGSSSTPPAEREDPFFHPSCAPNVNIHRDNIRNEVAVKKDHSLLNSNYPVFLLAACCILLLISLFCMVICKKDKVKIDENHIYNEPAFLWRARPPPPPLLTPTPPIGPSPGVCSDYHLAEVHDDPNPKLENCKPDPGSSCSTKSLGRPQDCRSQESRGVLMQNEYCIMGSPAPNSNMENDVCCSSRT